jgi:RNA polymerase sigma-70 factor (ECF subfamily)
MHTTSVSLLERLRQPPNHEAWKRFVHLYSPLLGYWAERTGFATSEVEDLVQEVFTHLAKEMPKFEYDPDKTFRGWLRTVAINKWNEIRRRRQIDADGVSHLDVDDAGSQDPAKLLATDEFQRLLFQRAMEVMQTDFPGNTWLACKKVIMDGQAAAEVAAELDMTVGAVHAARFRVLARLRQELAGMLD